MVSLSKDVIVELSTKLLSKGCKMIIDIVICNILKDLGSNICIDHIGSIVELISGLLRPCKY